MPARGRTPCRHGHAVPKAKRGYSRDKRPDCKQVVIALVVRAEGFPLTYEIFPGNTIDVTTLQDIVQNVETKHGRLEWEWDREKWRAAVRRDGAYLLRAHWPGGCDDPALLWQTCIQLTEAEAAFRTMKSELSIRPIRHKIQPRVEAHIMIAFLGYARCRAGAGSKWITPLWLLILITSAAMRPVHHADGR